MRLSICILNLLLFCHHLEEQQGAVGANEQTLPKTVERELDSYPKIPSKGWLPPVMNILPGSIRLPLKEKIPSKFKEGVGFCIRACTLKK